MMSNQQDRTALQLVVALLAAGSAYAQNTNTNNGGQATTGNNQQTNTQQTNANTAKTQTAAAGTQAPATTAAAATTPSGTTTGTAPNVSISAVPTDAGSGSAPSITVSDIGGLSDVPTIAGYGIPTAVVPFTQSAPFMVKSNYPEGTVFIAVGALLAFMGCAVLAWRGIVAWSLHKSVKRANQNLLLSEKKSRHTYGGAGGIAASSNLSLDRINPQPNRMTKSRSRLIPLQTAVAPSTRNSSLFFSPTAGAGHHSSPSVGPLLPTNRSSSYLPAGYYAAPGAAAPAAGAGIAHIGGPPRGSYIRHSNYGPSPPASPALPPSRGYDRSGLYQQQSSSSLNLNIPGGAHSGQRAPSANLEDLFDAGHLPGRG